MLIPCYKLKHALELVEPAVARKVTIPIHQNFLMQKGRVMATNLEIAIAADLPEVKGAAICLPHGLVSKFIRFIPDTEMLDLTVDRRRRTTIKAGRMTTTITGADPKDFPPFPETDNREESVDGDRLVNALMGALPTTARESNRPILTGVCLTFGDPIEVAGADGFRLMWSDVAMKLEPLDGEARYIVIPRASILALEKVWKKAVKTPAAAKGQGFLSLTAAKPSLEAAGMAIARRMVRLRHSAGKNLLILNLGEATLTTQLLEGEFPAYHTLIPEDQPHQVTFDAAEAARAVRMLSGMASEGLGTIRITWEGDSIEFSAQAEDIGDIAQSMPATIRGEPGRIAFEARYLLEYLSSKEGLILMETSTPSSPGRFTHERSPNAVLMPKFVQWEGDSEKEAKPDPQGEVDQRVDKSRHVATGGEPVADPEASTTTEGPASEPALGEGNITADTKPPARTRGGRRPPE